MGEVFVRRNEIFSFDGIVHWCDSKTVLAWVNSSSRKFNKFVKNRISESVEYFEEYKMAESRYVPSNLNVADEATKYAKPIDVSPKSIWINGPEFLRKPKNHWPENITELAPDEEICVTFLHKVEIEEAGLIDFLKFSSFTRLVAVIGWVIRFVNNLKRNKGDRITKSWLVMEEINGAKICLIKQAQWESYPKEMLILSGKSEIKELPKNSEIIRLNPVLHEGVLRVDGRIKAASCMVSSLINTWRAVSTR
jgi:hypothetical protein